MLDFNNADTQRTFDLIPDGTIAPVIMTIRPGEVGDGGWLTRGKNDPNVMLLNVEFIVKEGPYAKRKFWMNFTLDGTTDGHKTAANISAATLRSILESSRGIKPDDSSEDAMQRRRVGSYGDFDGMGFMAKIGIEPGKNGYKDKNVLASVITPDMKEWTKVESIGGTASPVGAATQNVVNQAAQASGNVPSWAG